MSKLHKNNKGFSAVEGLLIVVIVALVGVVGYMVYKNHHKITTNTVVAPLITANPTTEQATPAANPTAGWQSVSNPDGAWTTIEIPKSWLSMICDGGSYIGIGPDQASLGHCQSDAVSELSLTYSSDQSGAKPITKTSTDKTFADEAITVNGVQGHKYTVVEDPNSGAMDAGFTHVTYVFSSKGKIFTALYSRYSTDSDDRAIVDQIVRTWKF